MARSTFKIEGFAELDRELGRLSKASGKAALRKAGINAMEPTARLARSYAPDDPRTIGALDLTESIVVSSRVKVGRARQRLPEGKYTTNVYMGPTRKAYHGIFQEFGTINHRAQPFMRPAWDQDRKNIVDRLRLELWDTISAALDRARKRGAL